MKDESKKSSRRRFLKTGLIFGAASVVTSQIIQSCAQEHTMPVDKIKVLTTDGKVIEIEKALAKDVQGIQLATTKESVEGLPNRKFVMVIDLAKCKNARKCVSACQEGHNLAKDQEWMRIYLLQDNPQTAPYWFPRPCYHCDNPLCVSVCPVGATYKRTDGIVLVDSDKCIGCKFCMTGCPYSARIFNWHEPDKQKLTEKDYSPELNIPAKKGTVSKCTFCADKLRNNELPRCVVACPMGAIYFGNLLDDTVTNEDETVRFSEMMIEHSGYRYLETLGTLPSVFYLPPTQRMTPVEEGYDKLDENQKARYKDVEFIKNRRIGKK